jgi:hypothetical protein
MRPSVRVLVTSVLPLAALSVSGCGDDYPPLTAAPPPLVIDEVAEAKQIKLDDAQFKREQREAAREDHRIARADRRRRPEQRAISPSPNKPMTLPAYSSPGAQRAPVTQRTPVGRRTPGVPSPPMAPAAQRQLSIATARATTNQFVQSQLDPGERATITSCQRQNALRVLCTFDVTLNNGRKCAGAQMVVWYTSRGSLQRDFLGGSVCRSSGVQSTDEYNLGTGNIKLPTVNDVRRGNVPTVNDVRRGTAEAHP